MCGVPEPFAGMLRDHLTKRPNLPTTAGTLDTPWLFLGSRAGKHLDPQSIAPPTQNSGSISLGARNSAIQNLAAEVPHPLSLNSSATATKSRPPLLQSWDGMFSSVMELRWSTWSFGVMMPVGTDTVLTGQRRGAGFGAAARGLRCPDSVMRQRHWASTCSV